MSQSKESIVKDDQHITISKQIYLRVIDNNNPNLPFVDQKRIPCNPGTTLRVLGRSVATNETYLAPVLLVVTQSIVDHVCSLYHCNQFNLLVIINNDYLTYFVYKGTLKISDTLTPAEPPPKNNDGRTHCYWCKTPTKKWIGITKIEHHVCPAWKEGKN
jgi:hypothetical protein